MKRVTIPEDQLKRWREAFSKTFNYIGDELEGASNVEAVELVMDAGRIHNIGALSHQDYQELMGYFDTCAPTYLQRLKAMDKLLWHYR